ncbi:MAG: UPF0182 family protein, partial [Deltaproteobacteria bacterium]|nr:UPF0182 family protein [Deltaproteobacteria bacterium]
TRPGIYYGLSTNDYILTQTTEKEFDYPKGKSNKYTTYAGKGGVGIGSFFRRMLFAIRFADTNLLFTGTLKEKSRILFNRDVQERVRTVAPFLMLDQEPYITVVKGRMKWIQDAYTISYRYPYSQPTPLGRRSRINYIRNSVKVVVDAYDGTVELYVWDMKDPMIQTYRRIFPDLFKDRSAAPKEILRHVRYPKDLFTIQAAMYESFHMTTPRVWYNQEDKWNIARELAEKTVRRVNNTTAGAQGRAPRASAPGRGLPVNASKITQQSRMAPYFMIMTLPNEPKEEFLLMVPFTPNNKDNMVAWMTARCDGENYGKLLVYTFPKKKLIFGPMQIEARIDQDGFISQWFTLRNQQGSAVIRGDLLVIPIGDAILYVEPIYLQSTQTKLPELKQVIVAFGQHLAMKPSLAASLKAVFGVTDAIAAAKAHGGKGTAATHPALGPVVGTVRSLMAKALRLYKEGQGKLKAGDWAGYGRAQAELKATLEGLAKSLGGKLSPKKAQAVPEAATTLAPAVKVPAAKTPAAKTPAVKTPAVKTPAVKTPAAKTPAAK